MKKILPLACFLLLSFLAEAQSGFRPGYIIQNGDTLQGWIKKQSTKRNSFECFFKSTPQEEAKVYGASKIAGFGWKKGLHYRSRLIEAKPGTQSKTKSEATFYFLNVLVSGKADLYALKVPAAETRFFVKKDTVFKELIVKDTIATDSETGKTKKVREKLYTGTLVNMLQDCYTLRDTITATRLNKRPLVETFKAYNKCIHRDSLYYYRKFNELPVVTYGLTFGMNYSSINYPGNAGFTNTMADNPFKPGYQAGFNLNVTLPFLHKQLSVQTEVLGVLNYFYSEYRFSAPYTYGLGGTPETVVMDYHLSGNQSLYSIKVPLQLRYTFNSAGFLKSNRIKPFINAGAVVSSDMNEHGHGIIALTTPNTLRTSRWVTGVEANKLYAGPVVGAGILMGFRKHQAVFAELRYQPENINNLYSLSSKVRTISLNTGFRF